MKNRRNLPEPAAAAAVFKPPFLPARDIEQPKEMRDEHAASAARLITIAGDLARRIR